MTAEAMQGDRERFLAAGMNDYVVKPIRIEDLVAALERSPRRGGAPCALARPVRRAASCSDSSTAWAGTELSCPS